MKTQSTVDLDGADNLHRPPFNPDLLTTTQPLIVTPTLVSRVDGTPSQERPHDAGSSVDSSGNQVEQPGEHPSDFALEPNANLAYERWDEYWRKIHGPKFAYEEPGSTSHLVVRYDQLHRLPSGPSSGFRPPYRARVQSNGQLDGKPEAHVPPYERPKWDGLAYIAYQAKDDIRKTLVKQDQYSKRIIADEHVAFRVVTRQICVEYILIPSAQHRDAVSLVKIHQRVPSMTREQYKAKMLGEHANFVLLKTAAHSYVRRYVQLHNFGSTQSDPEGSSIDSLSIFAFASLNDVEDFVISEEYRAIEVEEAKLAGEGSEFWTAVNYSVINRLLPELPTELPPQE